ncbi:DUF4388 domain-containing protein [Desulfobacterales bacterium HSG2]|nr:DUF4388 domain-containing protein [Desulfobacterales bacterium HSG2]
MSVPEAMFKIVEEYNCPFYAFGDEFKLSGISLSLPRDKPACTTLVRDITDVSILCEKTDSLHTDEELGDIFNCSGCIGSIRLEYKREKRPEPVRQPVTCPMPAPERHESDISATANLLSNFSMFQPLNEEDIKELVTYLKLQQYAKGKIIIKKGDPGVNLFIMVSGKVEVMGDDDMFITFLGKGEVFGEMSLLSGDSVGATIRVVDPATVLYINGRDFRRMLDKFSSLQMYFARLLAKRLAKTNVIRSEEFASGMIGKLSEMPPTELFQTLNQNQKTGVLSLHLSRGPAKLFFKEGELLRAGYDGNEGRDAFFEMLKEEEGRFKFIPGIPPEELGISDLGDFMWLLMEGLNKIDEDVADMC